MGVACSPDIANLWGAYYEDWCFHNDSTLKDVIPFYHRFIDNMFLIVYANTTQEALDIAKQILLDNLGYMNIKLI